MPAWRASAMLEGDDGHRVTEAHATAAPAWTGPARSRLRTAILMDISAAMPVRCEWGGIAAAREIARTATARRVARGRRSSR
ncbi:hypothetical protein LVO79_11580 [Roseivivax marinus]|uniref:hypothetical protein n=1 Tax=Roseivivax marinus TaxID=1379903 RepID=UPI001F04B784|nr:hypothetical protein [Roseivivax marinus]UMA63674.1 hypothetical protein LVO79_11580 [Roseivivax marinus]